MLQDPDKVLVITDNRTAKAYINRHSRVQFATLLRTMWMWVSKHLCSLKSLLNNGADE